ncbi:MAG: D-alanyl-D-alanine carboxypeptidase/D-alanyl-D-alanine-endopeptidase [Marinobacter sp.]|nr:D-alanyl-D-alanine carboxypeptidase/D-alanyl-D-alanine-endopeptidase [Marinobacter sp.]
MTTAKRFSRSLAVSLAAIALSLPAAQVSADAYKWRSNILSHADRTIPGHEQGLSLAAIPLDGPGLEQFINADVQMNPGSAMKVITTFAALELLGPAFQWETRVYTDGKLVGDILYGNLYVKFGGDPKLTEERLWSMMRELRYMGIRTVSGDLVLDGGYFHLPNDLPSFEDNGDNPFAPFLVEPSAYLTNFNLMHFQVRADERGTQAWVTPQLDGVVIDNQVTATEEGPCPARRAFEWKPEFRQDGLIRVNINGTLPRGCRTTTYLSLLPQADYSASLIRALWSDMGGAIAGHNTSGETPEDARLLTRSSSQDLVTAVRDINKWSSNVMARQLLLTIGAEHRTEDDADDRQAGIRAITAWLETKGVNTAGMVIENGAGLSRDERLTAKQTAQILLLAWNSQFRSDLMSSLPVIAMDGTMHRRLLNTALVGEGRIKTGYLEGVRSIAGFARDKDKTTWAVVGYVNHTPAWNGQALLDRVLYSLYYTPPVGTTLSRADTDRD